MKQKELKRYNPGCKASRPMKSVSQSTTRHRTASDVPSCGLDNLLHQHCFPCSLRALCCEISVLVLKIWKSCLIPVPRAPGQAGWVNSELMAGFRSSDISQGRATCQELGCWAGLEPFLLGSLPFLLLPGRRMNVFLSRDPLGIRITCISCTAAG